MASRCDYYSDEEYRMAQEYEEQEHFNSQEEQYQRDIYQELLQSLEEIAYQLGVEHSISFLENLKNKVECQKNIDKEPLF